MSPPSPLPARPASGLPTPPPELAGGIGPGEDFWKAGWQTVEEIAVSEDLRALRSVLEIGSGLGRVALPLSLALPPDADYIGVDVADSYVAWCREHLGLASRFSFEHLDVHNSQYNPNGRRRATRARLPVKSGSRDLAIASSLFTHLVPDETRRYLSEARRCLRVGGRLFATFLLADSETVPRIESGQTYPPLPVRVQNAYLQDEDSPGRGVALDKEWLFATAQKAGLVPVEDRRGGWRSIDAYYQDIVVFQRER